MWLNVEGDSNFRVDVGAIVDNTGTGGNCTISWEVVLTILEIILPYVLQSLAEEPPLKEWQPDIPVHWAKAIVRSKAPFEGGHLQPIANPSVRTAGCDFNSLFLQEGYQYLTVTASADIGLVHYYWSQGDYLYWGIIPIGTYSVTFQVEVPVTNEPYPPSTPSGSTSGYTYTTYPYTTSTTDPNDDDVRYEFDWGDGSTTTTGWYTSGFTATASHYWSSTGTYYVKVRAQDFYYEYSDWSPYLTVSISSSGGGGGCPILSVYDGTGYVLEGLLDIHNLDGIDVVASHVLIHTPEPVEHRYLLRLTEHEQTYSHIDHVQLFATLKDGTEIKLPLVSAIHSEDGDVLWELRLSDDVRVDTLGADHNNGTSEYIDLEFVAPDGLEIEEFTFIIEGHNPYYKMVK